MSLFKSFFEGLNEKISLTCDSCNGVCCFNPPTLTNVDEVKIALQNAERFNAEVIFFEHDQDNYLVAIAKSDDYKCPFLSKEGKCNIYDQRFNVCKEYKCSAIKNGYVDIKDLISGEFLNDYENINKAKKKIPFIKKGDLKEIFSEKSYEKYIFKTKDLTEMSKKIYGVPADLFAGKISEIILKNKIFN